MKRLSPILLFLLTFLLTGGWAKGNRTAAAPSVVSVTDSIARHEAAELADRGRGHTRHNLTVPGQSQEPHQLISSEGIFRVCSTRSWRVLPTHASKQSKGSGRTTFVRHSRHTYSYFYYKGRHNIKNTPFRPVVSCDYYIYALRHIIC